MTTTSSDRIRQITVTVSEVACILGTLLGVGVFGGAQVQDSAGGALSSEATLIAPAGPAFSIWSVIYLGLACYTVWQWFPGQAADPRHRSIGYLAAASMLLNAGWLLVVQAGWLAASVVVILALVVVLGLIIARLADRPAASTADRVVVDGTFGLYVGWVSVAVCANITAYLVDSFGSPAAPLSEWIAVAVLLVAGLIGVVLARRSHGNIAIGAALVWGIGWIAVARLQGSPSSTITAVGAVVVALALLAVYLLSLARPGLRTRTPARAIGG